MMMLKYILLLSAGWLLGSGNLRGQVMATGRVMNSGNEPLAGASIRSLSKGNVVKSEAGGRFTILLPVLPDTIVISYIGYQSQRIPVSQAGVLPDIILPENDGTLEGVTVNTGYQKLKPNEINGSVTLVDRKLLNEQTGTNILQRLNGVTSGLIFNSGKVGTESQSNDITIRGLSTINGPLDPLIIVDNFPYEGDINNINPDDVESVTILKDASAASIWGARAGNGVIVITTKRARFEQRMRLSVQSSVLFTKPVDLFYKPQISNEDYLQVEEYLFNKGYFDADMNDINRPPLSPAVMILQKRQQGLISSNDSASMMHALSAGDTRKQYHTYFQRRGITQQHAVNVSGGNSQYAWLLAGSYNNVVATNRSASEKINVRMENRIKPVKNLEITLNAYYTASNHKTGMADFTTVSRLNGRYIPYMRFADDQGMPMPVDRYNRSYTDTAGRGRLLNWDYYPLEDYKHDYTVSGLQDIVARAAIRYDIYKGLSADIAYQYEKQWTEATRHADTSSFYARDLINKFTILPAKTAQAPTYAIPVGDIISQSQGSSVSRNVRGQLNYARVWGRHSATAILGGELDEAVDNASGGFTTYGYQDDPLSQGKVNFNTIYPTYITGAYDYIPGAPGVNSWYVKRFVSMYANGSYTFLKRYTASGSFRKDASNVFGLKTNDKWNPLWSVGVGWVLSQENFYHSRAMPYIKIRLTYGYSGNLDTRKTPLPVSAALTNTITGFPVQRISSLNNPSLRWEKSRQVNLGVDFETASKIITGSIEYYQKKGTDLYGVTPYDYTTWGRGQFITKNVADMSGRGIDVSMNTLNIDRAVRWRTFFIYNYNTSKTTKYYSDASQDVYTATGDGSMITPIVGKPLYAIAAYKWGGLNNQGDPRGYLDGVLSTDYNAINNAIAEKGLASGSIVYIGASEPVHFGSIINYLDWKGFSLSCNLMYKAGYYFKKNTFTSLELITRGIGHADYSIRWQQPGDEAVTGVPAFVYTDYPQFSERDVFYMNAEPNVVKGDHIRLHYINLAYQFRQKHKGGNLEVYVNAANLGILWRANRFKLDPDALSDYPAPKQYTIGLRAHF